MSRDCLATACERVLTFSGRPVVLLLELSVVLAQRVVHNGQPTGETLLTVEAALRESGPRFQGRALVSIEHAEFVAALNEGREVALLVRGASQHVELGRLLLATGFFADDPAQFLELKELAEAKGGSAIYAELMKSTYIK